jgi:hypothetical protein
LCDFGCVKALGFDDRKRIYIVNIDPFAIAEPRGFDAAKIHKT